MAWAKWTSSLPHKLTNEKDPPVFLNIIKGPKSQPIDRPIGITTDKGILYVANNNPSRIDKFLPSGKRLGSFYVSPKNTLSLPMGIAIDWVGKIYVSDVSNASIKVFDKDGKYLYWFPKPIPGMPVEDPFINPLGLFSQDKNLYVIDAGDSSVKVFSTAGTKLLSFGKPGTDPGDMQYPNSIALTDDNELLVSDSNNARVQIFSSKGKVLGQLEQPIGKRPWLLPRGIAVDGFGRIHVVDNMSHRINVYDKNKKFLFSYGSKDDRDVGEGLNFANGIAIDKELRLIYVADTGNNRIIVWGY